MPGYPTKEQFRLYNFLERRGETMIELNKFRQFDTKQAKRYLNSLIYKNLPKEKRLKGPFTKK